MKRTDYNFYLSEKSALKKHFSRDFNPYSMTIGIKVTESADLKMKLNKLFNSYGYYAFSYSTNGNLYDEKRIIYIYFESYQEYKSVILSTKRMYLSNLICNSFSEPETSEPETSEPETSEPETSEPEYSIMVYDGLTGSFVDRIFFNAENMDKAKIKATEIMLNKKYKYHSEITYIVIS